MFHMAGGRGLEVLQHELRGAPAPEGTPLEQNSVFSTN